MTCACLLLVLYWAEQARSEPVSPEEVLDTVETLSATTMAEVDWLEQRGMLELDQFGRATLTSTGRDTAEELAETHATLTAVFDEGLDIEDSETAALSIVGVVSPTVTNQLASTLAIDSAQSALDPEHDTIAIFESPR
jgi:Mn-dependent DtxR family transcriptional regulator